MIPPLLRSVLLVEDEPGLRLALRTHFLRHGWSVAVASGVREATTALGLERFDLIVSDLRMLDGDGFQVLAAVQAHAPETAVLFLTASPSIPEAVQAVREGAVDYMAKPVSFDLLLTQALRILKEPRPLTASALPGTPVPLEMKQCSTPPAAEVPSLSMSDLERKHLSHTLELVGGNRTRAAEVLGISVRTLRNKVRQYDLPPRRYA